MATREIPIDYYIYCPKCKYYEFPEKTDPCFKCLNETFGYTSIPIKFEENRT